MDKSKTEKSQRFSYRTNIECENISGKINKRKYTYFVKESCFLLAHSINRRKESKLYLETSKIFWYRNIYVTDYCSYNGRGIKFFSKHKSYFKIMKIIKLRFVG